MKWKNQKEVSKEDNKIFKTMEPFVSDQNFLFLKKMCQNIISYAFCQFSGVFHDVNTVFQHVALQEVPCQLIGVVILDVALQAGIMVRPILFF